MAATAITTTGVTDIGSIPVMQDRDRDMLRRLTDLGKKDREKLQSITSPNKKRIRKPRPSKKQLAAAASNVTTATTSSTTIDVGLNDVVGDVAKPKKKKSRRSPPAANDTPTLDVPPSQPQLTLPSILAAVAAPHPVKQPASTSPSAVLAAVDKPSDSHMSPPTNTLARMLTEIKKCGFGSSSSSAPVDDEQQQQQPEQQQQRTSSASLYEYVSKEYLRCIRMIEKLEKQMAEKRAEQVPDVETMFELDVVMGYLAKKKALLCESFAYTMMAPPPPQPSTPQRSSQSPPSV